MNRWIALALLAPATHAADVIAPQPTQFARGVEVVAQADRPLVQVTLPDELYRTVTRTDLGDVRVFNRSGSVVPHALCAAPDREAPTIASVELPVVPIQAARARVREGVQINVQTDGTRIDVSEAGNAAGSIVDTQAHVIDATGVEYELRAIEFDWHAPDGSSEARVRIDASGDLDRWQTIVAGTSLVRAGDQEQLRRGRVTIPQGRYRYLRIARIDSGPPIQIDGAQAEQVMPGSEIEPLWFTPQRTDTTPQGEVSTSDHRAPIRYARLKLPDDNMTVRATLRSRHAAESPWIERWHGEFYSVVTNGERKTSSPAALDGITDRQWQLQLNGSAPNVVLQLGYRPAVLRFMAQGAGPFTIAYGSAQVQASSALGCNDLLSNVDPSALQAMIGEAGVIATHALGGDEALRPVPKKTSARLIVLWSVLIVGVGLLIAMALSLMKRVRE